MKKLTLLLSFLFLASFASHAQNWSAGYRTGIERTGPLHYDDGTKSRLLWNNQVFVNRKIIKRLEAEINLTHNATSYTDSSMVFDGPDLIVEHGKINRLSLGLNLRYYVLYKSRWSAFVQAGAISSKSWTSYDGVGYYYWTNEAKPFSGKVNSAISVFNTLTAGIGTTYSLNKRFYLNGMTDLLYRPHAAQYMEWPYGTRTFSWSLHVGLGFRF